VLFSCLSQHAPFEAADPAALTYLPIVSLPPPLSAYTDHLPARLERIVMALLSRNPKRRPTLDNISAALDKAIGTAVDSPIVGMYEEREELRRALVGACDHECRVVVVYGPVGCGRRTLINEALLGARREGLRVAAYNSKPSVVLAASKKGGPPLATAWNASSTSINGMLALDAAHAPGLFLIRSKQPIARLAKFVHVTPSALDSNDITRLLTFRDGTVPEPDRADAIRAQTGGLPSAVHVLFASKTGDAEQALPEISKRILAHLREHGETAVEDVATAFKMGELSLLDHCEVLFSCGLVESNSAGTDLRAP